MVDESLIEEKRARVRHRASCARVRSVPRTRDAVARGRRDTRRRALACRGVTFHASRHAHAVSQSTKASKSSPSEKRLGHAKPDIAIGPQTSIGLEGAILRLVIR